MDFARSQLEKHGWSEGKGLGRAEHGMTDAIKVKLKFDTAGVGHNPGDEFTYHWWENVFNKAANNIKVNNSQEGVQVETEEDLAVSTKKPLSKALANKEMLYGRFIKAATLNDGKMTAEASSESDSEEDEEKNENLRQCTDEELFKICEGRTAHKGARHGITASAKLARIQEQERSFLAKYSSKVSDDIDSQKASEKQNTRNGDDKKDVIEVVTDDLSKKKKKKKKKKSKKECVDEESASSTPKISENDSDPCRSDDSGDEHARSTKENDGAADVECVQSDERTKKRRKKKKKRSEKEVEVLDDNNHTDQDCCEIERGTGKEKKKKRKLDKEDEVEVEEGTENVPSEPCKKKKSKKQKR